MAINKVVYGNEVLIDLTSDTVSADKMAKDITAHDKSGNTIVGTNENDSNTQDATVAVAEILDGKTAYARGTKLTGTMPNNGAVSGKISGLNTPYNVPLGFHDGSGTVDIESTEKEKIVPANIKSGVELLGVVGTYGGEEISAQSKTATPSVSQQTILPDVGYDYLSQVVVKAIPRVDSENSAGGITTTIG